MSGCWGIDKNNHNAFCVPDYKNYECYAYTPRRNVKVLHTMLNAQPHR